MAKASLPPGFRFHPTDLELTLYYLKRKIMGKGFHVEAIADIDLYKFAPWDLPDKACLRSKDLVWYFFCTRDKKYTNGSRTNRSTGVGYWKATGRDRPVINNSSVVGMKRTLVFHLGKPPHGERTDWVMYEYRLEDKELAGAGIQLDACVLCKVFEKSGRGPKVGAQYGAPFNEDEWDDDATTHLASSVPFESSHPPESNNGMLDSVAQHSVASDVDEVPSTLVEPACEQSLSSAHDEMSSAPDFPNDGISIELLTAFLNDSPPHSISNTSQDDLLIPDLASQYDHNSEFPFADAEGIFHELENLASQSAARSEDFSCSKADDKLQPNLSERETGHYLELNDFSFLGESDPFDLMALNNLSANHAPAFQTSFLMEHSNLTFDASVITTSMDGSSASMMPSVVDEK